MSAIYSVFHNSDSLYLHPGGPYIIRNGDDVTIVCTCIPQQPDIGEVTFGWEKLIEGTFTKLFVFMVQNGTIESLYECTPARFQIGNESFSVTFTASASHQGEYRCLYSRLPLIHRSNTTFITLKGEYV